MPLNRLRVLASAALKRSRRPMNIHPRPHHERSAWWGFSLQAISPPSTALMVGLGGSYDVTQARQVIGGDAAGADGATQFVGAVTVAAAADRESERRGQLAQLADARRAE